jgi:hypothetical protein
MNYTTVIDVYNGRKYCYDHPNNDIYAAIATVLIWVYIISFFSNCRIRVVNVDDTKRIVELNERLEAANDHGDELSEQNESLDEQLRVVQEQLRVLQENYDNLQNIHNTYVSAVSNLVELLPNELRG